MESPITIQENVQGGKIVAIKPLILEPKPIEVIKVNELLEPVYSSCNGKLSWVKVGDVRVTNNYGAYRVIEDLGVLDYGNQKYRFFKIQFIETGFVTKVTYNELKSGKVKDTYKRSVYGVGFLGKIDFKLPYFRDLYLIWNNILDRCYNPKHNKYQNYGGRGVFVSSKWYCFRNFYFDVQELKGWDNKLKDWKKYSLDKDILFASNHYSKETCIWASENEQKLNTTQTNYFSAISPIGNKEYFVGTNFISKKYSLQNQNVSSCLSKKRKSHKGWTNFQPIIPPQDYVLRWWKY